MRFRRALFLLECEGMDVKTLSAMLGHMSAATTLDIYMHATSDKHAAARKIYAHTREECAEKLKVLITEMKAELAELKRQKADRH